jgi:hypothetical protein
MREAGREKVVHGFLNSDLVVWTQRRTQHIVYDLDDCRMRRLSAEQARGCLSGKRIVFLGDSVTRYQVGWEGDERVGGRGGIGVQSREVAGLRMEVLWWRWFQLGGCSRLLCWRAQSSVFPPPSLPSFAHGTRSVH